MPHLQQRLPPLMLLLLAAGSLLISSCSCQQMYYCDSPGRQDIRDIDFYIVVGWRVLSAPCSFRATPRRYWIEVQVANIGVPSQLAISSGVTTLLRGSRIEEFEKTMMTESAELRVDFLPHGISIWSAVRLRVRYVPSGQCPPAWVSWQLSPSHPVQCVGSSSSDSRLPFEEAQRSCNRMRANLLTTGSGDRGGIDSVWKLLPHHLGNDAWIGVTDLSSRFSYYWLDGLHFSDRASISCWNGDYPSCTSRQRCGATTWAAFQSAQMLDCSSSRRFVCLMPVGGTSLHYAVPTGSVAIHAGVSWIAIVVFCALATCVLAAFVFLISLIVVFFRRRRRRLQQQPQQQQQQQQQQRQQQTTGTVWTVTLPPPPPTQREQLQQQQQQQRPASAYPPQAPTPPYEYQPPPVYKP